MNATAKIVIPDHVAGEKVYDVQVHLRFSPGTILQSIGYCPAHLTINQWHDHLCARAGDYYQAFSNGRGLFQLPRGVYDTLVAEVSQ